jgi:hypothetical protein
LNLSNNSTDSQVVKEKPPPHLFKGLPYYQKIKATASTPSQIVPLSPSTTTSQPFKTTQTTVSQAVPTGSLTVKIKKAVKLIKNQSVKGTTRGKLLERKVSFAKNLENWIVDDEKHFLWELNKIQHWQKKSQATLRK